MSVLVDHQIKSLINKRQLEITPFDESLVNPASLDVRLSGFFSTLFPKKSVINPLDKESYTTVKLPNELDSIVLEPGQCILGSTLEIVGLPDDISAQLIGKSSLARTFIDNSSFGGYIDPGFRGTIVMEIINHSQYKMELTKSMKIAQLVFFMCSDSAETPYNKKKDSKYMNQGFAEGSQYWKNA